MSKAVYFFCADLSTDPVANNVFKALAETIKMSNVGIEIDGYDVLEHVTKQNHQIQFVRTNDVLSHDYRRYMPIVNKYFAEYDFAGLVNWHEGSNAPHQVLTVHSTGDVPSGTFGNVNPALFKNLISAINRNCIASGLDDFSVSTEGTHWSGIPHQGKPEWINLYSVPIYDIEIGSCKEAWENNTAVKVLAMSLCDVFIDVSKYDQLFTLLCVGGVHFEESFLSAILSEKHPLSIGHILPNQWLVSGKYDDDDSSGFTKLIDSVNSVNGGIHAVVFHDNLKSVYKQLCKAIGEKYNIPVFKHKTLRDLDRTIAIINGTEKQ